MPQRMQGSTLPKQHGQTSSQGQGSVGKFSCEAIDVRLINHNSIAPQRTYATARFLNQC
jgi:hypothetical protein